MEQQYQVQTAGRKDIADYFRMHIGRGSKLVHSPLLAFKEEPTCVSVEIIIKPVELLALPDETKVMGIWPGQWRSDYFQFTVGEYRTFYNGGTKASGE